MEFFLILISPICVSVSSFFVIYIIRFFDVVEKEPWKPIIISFLLGISSALFTIFFLSIFPTLSFILSLIFEFSDETYNNFGAIIEAPILEEVFKLFALILVYSFFKKDFHTLTDFIIYSCIVAAGFEFLENLNYLIFSVFETDFFTQWSSQLVSRVIATGYGHPLYTSWSGFGLWILLKTNSTKIKAIFFVLISIALHFINNLAAVLSSYFFLGNFLYEVSFSITLASFLFLVGFSLIRDFNLVNDFVFKIIEIYTLNESEINSLKKLAKPVNNLFARSNWSWRLSNRRKNTTIPREAYVLFSKYALSYSDEYAGKDKLKKKIYLDKAVNLLTTIS